MYPHRQMKKLIFPAEHFISNNAGLVQAEARCVALESALAFYAERNNWRDTPERAPCLRDGGDLAREVFRGSGWSGDVKHPQGSKDEGKISGGPFARILSKV